MSRITFETVSVDELAARHDDYWDGALAALGTPELDADTDTPDPLAEGVSFVLPYKAAQHRYLIHIQGCRTCTEEPFWSTACEYGTRLAHEAADAMSLQDRLAASN